MTYIFEILGWWLLSIVKFLATPSAMVIAGNGILKTIVISSSGAAIGVTLFYFFGELLFKWLDKVMSKKNPKKFTRTNKMIVRVKNKYGIYGLMFISVIISVPISGLLAARLFKDKSSVLFLISGFSVWAVILTVITYYVKNLVNG